MVCVCAVCGKWRDGGVCVWRVGAGCVTCREAIGGEGLSPRGAVRRGRVMGPAVRVAELRSSRKETRAEQVWRGDRCESRNSSSEWPVSGWVPRGPGAWSSGVSPEGNEMLMFLEHGLDGILCFYHVCVRFL